MNRLRVILLVGLIVLTAAGIWATVSTFDTQKPVLVWGTRGVRDGDLARPRAAAIDGKDRLFIVDFTARVQGYDLDGHHLGLTFTTPDFRKGRPSGLGVDNQGRLLVADSHYHCVRTYDSEGKELKSFGGESGTNPGQFGYISDVVQDKEGFYYVSEFGQNDRITKLDADGKFVASFGENGQGPLQFNRVRALALGPDGNIYLADACNHRIQVLTLKGEFVRQFGEAGPGLGQLSYPYDLTFTPAGYLYVVERGNQRVQKFTIEGKPLGTWGTPGKEPGQLADPWAIVADRFGLLHVIDTENHRVQRIRF